MWEAANPDPDDDLRQGDLLINLRFPRVETIRFDDQSGVTGAVAKKAGACVVLEQCCTHEQQNTLTLGRVTSYNLAEDSDYLGRLRAMIPGEEYARYEHLLEPAPGWNIPIGTQRVIDLRERITMRSNSNEDWADLRAKRIARMTVLARALLRQKLAVHFARATDEDRDALREMGLGPFGQPED